MRPIYGRSKFDVLLLVWIQIDQASVHFNRTNMSDGIFIEHRNSPFHVTCSKSSTVHGSERTSWVGPGLVGSGRVGVTRPDPIRSVRVPLSRDVLEEVQKTFHH